MIPRAHRRSPEARKRRGRRARMEGMTLIEILIVIVVIGLAAAAISVGLGKVTRAEMRASSTKIVAAARFAFSRAVTHGNTVRLVFDLDANTMAFEEAPGFVTLASSGDPRRSDDEGTDDSAVDPLVSSPGAAEQHLRADPGHLALPSRLGRGRRPPPALRDPARGRRHLGGQAARTP